MKSKDLPVGYWIRKADELLTNGIDAVHSTFGLTRTGWQVLNAVSESGAVSLSDLTALIKPFAHESAVTNIIDGFRARRLVEENEGHIQLTEEGRQLHSGCLERQRGFRERCMREISPKDYETTVLTLKRLVANLEE